MKIKKKLHFFIIAALAVLYLVLLFILYEVEVADPESTIKNFGDAFWYSLVTLTTVGYGDVSPVTPIGRVVGVVFLLLSTSILVTLLGTAISFLTGEAMPLLILSFQKRKNWYFFADNGPEADTLARMLYYQDSKGLIIFKSKRSERESSQDFPCIYADVSLEKIIERKKHVGNPCTVFLLQENGMGETMPSVRLSNLPVRVFVRTSNGQDHLPGDIHFFHSYDCCAREYWRKRPLCANEKSIVIIGFGNYGRALLKRAILTNIISDEQQVTYHIFGESKNYQKIHNHLNEVFAVNELSDTRDSLIFHDDIWQENHEVLAEADRIIICPDSDTRCWYVFWHIKRYYAIKGRMHIRNDRETPGVACFGTDEEIYTPEHVMSTKLNEVAIAMNDLYRKNHPRVSLTWEALGDNLRQSKIAAADHVLMKARYLLESDKITKLNDVVLRNASKVYIRMRQDPVLLEKTRKMEHQRWMRFYAYYNWTYAPERNEKMRQDPRVRPYEELSKVQKIQCDFAWRLIGQIILK